MHENPQTYSHVVASLFLLNRGAAVLWTARELQGCYGAGKKHTGTVLPSVFLHQVVQLGRPVTGVLQSFSFNASETQFAPYMTAIRKGTRDVGPLVIITSIHMSRTFAPFYR